MKLIYRAKWIIVVLFAIMFFFSFAVLFAGGTTKINWCLLTDIAGDQHGVGICNLERKFTVDIC